MRIGYARFPASTPRPRYWSAGSSIRCHGRGIEGSGGTSAESTKPSDSAKPSDIPFVQTTSPSCLWRYFRKEWDVTEMRVKTAAGVAGSFEVDLPDGPMRAVFVAGKPAKVMHDEQIGPAKPLSPI